MTRTIRLLAGGVLALAMPVMGVTRPAPAALAAPSPSLGAETLVGYVPTFTDICDWQTDSGSATFSVTGVAIGPAPGRFTESGSFTVSNGTLTAFSASFSITDTSGTVVATGGMNLFQGQAGCSSPSSGQGWGIAADLSYTATINGSVHDSGDATLTADPDSQELSVDFTSTPSVGASSAACPSAHAAPFVDYRRSGPSFGFFVCFPSAAPGQGYVLFGPGPGCIGLVATATKDVGTGTIQHFVVVTGDDMNLAAGAILPGATSSFVVETVTASGAELGTNGGKCYTVSVPPR